MYEGHALDEITIGGTFKRAREAASFARLTGSRGTTDRIERRQADGTLDVIDGVTVEAIEVNRHWGPAYRVKGLDVVIVLASRPGRYKSHAA